MSPSRSSRSSALCIVLVLIVIEPAVNGFAIRSAYNTSNDRAQDLAVEESLQLEVKHDFKKFNAINVNSSVKNNEFSTTTNNVGLLTSPFTLNNTIVEVEVLTTTMTNNVTFNDKHVNTSDSTKRSNNITVTSSLPLNSSLYDESPGILKERVMRAQSQMIPKNITSSLKSKSDLENISLSIDDIKTRPISARYVETSTVFDDSVTGAPFTRSEENIFVSTKEYQNMRGNKLTTEKTESTDLFSWKKYTVMDRKRTTTTEENPFSTYKHEEANKLENRTILDDSIMKGARNWILKTKSTQGTEYITSTTNLDILTVHQEISTEPVNVPKKLEYVSSKRAGFLNFSSKSKQTETTTGNYAAETTSDNDYTTPTLENNEEDHTNANLAVLLESQRYLVEDAIKEELLQETSLKNNEEIAKQIREERLNNTATATSSAEQYITDTTYGADGTSRTDSFTTEGAFNNKPVQDKGKGGIVYTVSPNYKPMKKIEIVPPKPFVRDPDDNSWRNESISSLGIVFKPKNSSKPFTQVLKYKTETEWSNTLGRDNKSDVPGLRERLEKIARKRKTKKKTTDLFGDIIYSDYEESNSSEEITSTQNTAYTSTNTSSSEDETTITTAVTEELVHESSTPSASAPGNVLTVTSTDSVIENNTNLIPTLPAPAEVTNRTLNVTKEKILKKVKYDPSLIEKGKKYFNIFDYYDVSDEDESEYIELAKIELKKFSAPVPTTDAQFTTPPTVTPHQFTRPITEHVPERKPTLQYFPPRNTQQPKTNRFDNDFEKKFKNYAKLTSPKQVTSVSVFNSPDTPLGKYHSQILENPSLLNDHHHTFSPELHQPNVYEKHHYHTDRPQVTTEQRITDAVTDHNEGYNRGSNIIKTYKDFLNQASKDYDYDRDAGLIPYTRSPPPAVTFSDLIAQEKDKFKPSANFNYDYDAKFRKEVLQRFVENFNHNEARHDRNFPVLYNNTVLHVSAAAGSGDAIASSRAFLRGLYKPADTGLGYARREPYDLPCDNVTVELSPAYELHYYVPDQEENEEMENRAAAAAH